MDRATREMTRLRFQIATDQATDQSRRYWEAVLSKPVTGLAALRPVARVDAVAKRVAWEVA